MCARVANVSRRALSERGADEGRAVLEPYLVRFGDGGDELVQRFRVVVLCRKHREARKRVCGARVRLRRARQAAAQRTPSPRRVLRDRWSPYLRVDDKHDGAAAAKDHLRVKGRVEKVDLPREVPHLELHERAVGDVWAPTGPSSAWPATSRRREQACRRRRQQRPVRAAPFLMTLLVLSKKSVSLGDILWNTTFWMLDLPLLCACACACVCGAAARQRRRARASVLRPVADGGAVGHVRTGAGP